MDKDYEKIVMNHYSKVAKEDGDSEISTMKDEYVREKETEAILRCIKKYSSMCDHKIRLLDVGCGNGYTLERVFKRFPNIDSWGLEKNDDLREIATSRMMKYEMPILSGDVRNSIKEDVGMFDIIISQRVIINLLDRTDQMTAIRNIYEALNKNGYAIFIECFKESLDKLNDARFEYQLLPINPAYHNLYLEENDILSTQDWENEIDKDIPEPNFLSSHFYITRVLHDVTLGGKSFVRNSDFVNFMTSALPENIGDYSPIKIYCMRKK